MWGTSYKIITTCIHIHEHVFRISISETEKVMNGYLVITDPVNAAAYEKQYRVLLKSRTRSHSYATVN